MVLGKGGAAKSDGGAPAAVKPAAAPGKKETAPVAKPAAKKVCTLYLWCYHSTAFYDFNASILSLFFTFAVIEFLIYLFIALKPNCVICVCYAAVVD